MWHNDWLWLVSVCHHSAKVLQVFLTLYIPLIRAWPTATKSASRFQSQLFSFNMPLVCLWSTVLYDKLDIIWRVTCNVRLTTIQCQEQMRVSLSHELKRYQTSGYRVKLNYNGILLKQLKDRNYQILDTLYTTWYHVWRKTSFKEH